jgi:hypothetical protein
LAAIIEPNFWITDMWKPNLCVWILSLFSGVIGASAGRRSVVTM